MLSVFAMGPPLDQLSVSDDRCLKLMCIRSSTADCHTLTQKHGNPTNILSASPQADQLTSRFAPSDTSVPILATKQP